MRSNISDVREVTCRDGHVFVSSGHNKGCELLKLTFKDKTVSVSRVWANRKADFLFGEAILWKKHI